MKKILLVMVGCLMFAAQMYAQKTLSDRQKKLRSDIVLFLKEEGFLPKIDSDGDIDFKKEGKQFYVIIDERDEDPFYISIAQSYSYGSTYTQERVTNALSETNLKKGVKVLIFDTSFSYRAEMYLCGVDQFRCTFYKLMSQLQSLDEEIDELCGN